MGELIMVVVGAALINNFVLTRFLGLCPFFGVSRRVETAIGMSMAVVFVMTIAGMTTWMINEYVLEALDLVFLRTVSFILVIASLVQLVEMVIKKSAPNLYQALGVFLPLITTNCAVIGVALLNVVLDLSLLRATFFSLGAGLGFGLAITIFAGIRERQEIAEIPRSFAGYANAFIGAGLLSLAFFVFSGYPSTV